MGETWDNASADYDLHLYGSDGNLKIWSDNRNSVGDSVEYSLGAGDSCFVGVFGWDGGTGAWTVYID